MKSKSSKQQAVDRLYNVLKGQAMFILEDDLLTSREKNEQMDVIVHLTHCLKEYEQELHELEATDLDFTK